MSDSPLNFLVHFKQDEQGRWAAWCQGAVPRWIESAAFGRRLRAVGLLGGIGVLASTSVLVAVVNLPRLWIILPGVCLAVLVPVLYYRLRLRSLPEADVRFTEADLWWQGRAFRSGMLGIFVVCSALTMVLLWLRGGEMERVWIEALALTETFAVVLFYASVRRSAQLERDPGICVHDSRGKVAKWPLIRRNRPMLVAGAVSLLLLTTWAGIALLLRWG